MRSIPNTQDFTKAFLFILHFRMFQNVNGMLEQFSKFKGKGQDHLQVMPEFNAHAQAIIMTIEAMIFIDQTERFDRKITDVLRSHINRKNSPAGSRLFQVKFALFNLHSFE